MSSAKQNDQFYPILLRTQEGIFLLQVNLQLKGNDKENEINKDFRKSVIVLEGIMGRTNSNYSGKSMLKNKITKVEKEFLKLLSCFQSFCSNSTVPGFRVPN